MQQDIMMLDSAKIKAININCKKKSKLKERAYCTLLRTAKTSPHTFYFELTFYLFLNSHHNVLIYLNLQSMMLTTCEQQRHINVLTNWLGRLAPSSAASWSTWNRWWRGGR